MAFARFVNTNDRISSENLLHIVALKDSQLGNYSLSQTTTKGMLLSFILLRFSGKEKC
jgi:hypothetical protein